MADDVFPSMVGVVNYDTSPERLARVQGALEGSGEGSEALRYLKENTIAVRFLNPRNPKEFGMMGDDNATYDPRTRTILLNPAAPDDRLVSDIPHEIWHVGQDRQGILSAMQETQNPTQKVALKYAVEAAAYTQQAIDGVLLPQAETKVTQDGKTLMDLRQVYESALGQHKTQQEARLDVFKAALRYESKFDDTTHMLIEKMGMVLLDARDLPEGDPGRGKPVAQELPDAKFAELLRRAGNMALSGEGGNFLASMSDADVEHLATSQLTPRSRQALAETQALYDELRTPAAPPRNR